MTEAIQSTTPRRAYTDGEEHLTCSTEKKPTNAKPNAQLEAWDRMGENYSSQGGGGACRLEPMCYAPAMDVPRQPMSTPSNPETYEQCVNREAYEASKVGRWAGATAGCTGAAATAVPAGPIGMGGMCVVGGVAGYYAGGDGGASIGKTDGKVECDHPDKPGSPSARARHQPEASTVADHAPIKG